MDRLTFTTEEIAELTGFSAEHIRQQIRKDRLRAAGGGKGTRYRVSRAELARWWSEEEDGGELFEEKPRAFLARAREELDRAMDVERPLEKLLDRQVGTPDDWKGPWEISAAQQRLDELGELLPETVDRLLDEKQESLNDRKDEWQEERR